MPSKQESKLGTWSTPSIAYLGGVIMVIAIYILISMVVVGHLSFAEVALQSDNALSATAQQFMGRAGFVTISGSSSA
ncbi:hypothetical protein [Haloferula sp.]|uniref:hypothetical protein n=1 Tax=Haloferula sp. TaxID=2497595 RepID=UPI003C758754